jgi:glycosyltransferase involved in cell wall biosynthesis
MGQLEPEIAVPSHHEPFGLTAAEALACGTPVVASNAVGAVEGFRACCERFRAGDAAAFEAALRTGRLAELLDRIARGGR